MNFGPGSLMLSGLVVIFGGGVEIAAARADCAQEVKILYREHLNGYKRPPYRSVRFHYNADGSKKVTYEHIVETPLRTIAIVNGGAATLAIDAKSWTGPTKNGPWKPSVNYFPKDRRGQHENIMKQNIKNMTDIKCGGLVEKDGKKLLHYHFTTKTDPVKEQGGMWFGSTDDVYVDPKSKLVLRWDRSNFVTSFSPKGTGEYSTDTFVYDKTIKVNPPQ